jgi:predicted alpha/beta hydrolase family esterase
LFLIAPAIEDTPTEVLWTFTLKSFNFDQLERQCKDIYLYHSTDDTYVPISNTEILKENITGAHMRIFHDKWHFYLEERLIELEQDIKA